MRNINHIKPIVMALLFAAVLPICALGVRASSTAPNINAFDISYDAANGYADAMVEITGFDGYGVEDCGFLYSFINPSPDFTTVRTHVPVQLNGASIAGSFTFGSAFTPEYDFAAGSAPKPNSTLYVRGYILDNRGMYHYGNTISVSGVTPMTVNLDSIEEVGETTAIVHVSATGISSDALGKLGVKVSVDKSQVTKEDDTAIDFPAQVISSNDTTLYIDGLDPDTTYYMAAYADFHRPTADVVFSKDVLSFTTLPDDNLTILTPVLYTATAHESASLGAYMEDSGAADIIDRGFVYSDMNGISSVFDGQVVSSTDFSVRDFFAEISGLNPGSVYNVRAYIKRATGEYVYSEPLQFTTAELPPPVETEKPYMLGIGSGMFGPDNSGTYMEVASMLYTLLADSGETYYSSMWYSDVDYSDPLIANIVNFVSSRGYMVGSDTGFFLTNEPISRAAVAVIICKVLGLLEEYNGSLPIPSAFRDTDIHWSSGYVYLAVMRGILNGYNEDGAMLFKPENYVSKAELAAIFSQMFGRTGEPVSGGNFTDVPAGHWAYVFIMNAAAVVY